jgi:hypothetical protein
MAVSPVPLQDRLLRVVITLIGVGLRRWGYPQISQITQIHFFSEGRFIFSKNTNGAEFEEFESV